MTTKSISLLFALAEAFIFVAQTFNVLLHRKDINGKSRIRFLVLIGSFIAFNLLNIIAPELLGLDSLKTRLFIHLGGFLITSNYLLYFIKEYRIFDHVLDSSNSRLAIILTLFASYISSFFLYGGSKTAREVLIILPIVISIIICLYTYLQNRKNKTDDRQAGFILFSVYFGIILMTSLPFIIHQNVCNEINIGLINGSFILLSGTYFYQLSIENRRQQEALLNYGYYEGQKDITKYGLTNREIEIADLILLDKTYLEIADSMFISIGTVTKHASNIFKKTGCKNREEFSKKFKQDS